jgi:hypothetical protein
MHLRKSRGLFLNAKARMVDQIARVVGSGTGVGLGGGLGGGGGGGGVCGLKISCRDRVSSGCEIPGESALQRLRSW